MYKKYFGSRGIVITSPDRIFFSKPRITKEQVIEYYAQVAPFLLPYTKNRLLVMRRFPEGITHEGFFHKDAPDYFPAWIPRVEVERQEKGGFVHYAVCNSVSTLVYLANIACLELHVSLSKVDKLVCPDQLIFDLDPSQDNDFDSVKKIALLLKEQLELVALVPFIKLTGSRGLHVVVPLRRSEKVSFDQARLFATHIADRVIQQVPQMATREIRKKERKGRVFIDTLRNGFGATAVAAYAIRALPGAPVAAPLLWEELGDRQLSAQKYTINTIFKRLDALGDVWEKMAASARRLP